MLATSIGMDEELDKEYGIDANEGGSLYRLFVKGSHTPVCKEELDESGTMTLVGMMGCCDQRTLGSLMLPILFRSQIV